MKNNASTLTMGKKGQFVSTKGSEFQCIAVDNKVYDYEIEVRCEAQFVNETTGWLMDVRDVDTYFYNKYNGQHAEPALSCEVMAYKAMKDLYAIFTGHGARVDYIRVRIYGAAGGFIDAAWERPTLPNWVPSLVKMLVESIGQKDVRYKNSNRGYAK